MAKKNSEAEGGVQVEESFSRLETFFEENQNAVLGVLGAVIIIVAGFVIYNRFIIAPKAEEASRQVFRAQQWFEADSFRLALEGDGNYYGFYDIQEDFGATPVGKMARYYIGICNLQLGNYDEAIGYLSKFKTSDPNVQAVAYGGLGDAYAELDDLEQAVKHYEKAGDIATLGSIAPIYYIRAGKAYEVIGDTESARKMYQAVVDNYEGSSSFDTAQKHLARVEASLN
jgi:tetratricopeptide (TPR) repeat protein